MKIKVTIKAKDNNEDKNKKGHQNKSKKEIEMNEQ